MARFNYTDLEIIINPEVIIIAPDPHTGLLNHRFNISYELKGMVTENIAGPLGHVLLQPLDTLHTVSLQLKHYNYSLILGIHQCKILSILALLSSSNDTFVCLNYSVRIFRYSNIQLLL